MSENDKEWRHFRAYWNSRNDEQDGTVFPLADPVASSKPGDHPEKSQSVSSGSGGVASQPTSSINSSPVAKEASKKRSAGPSASNSLCRPKTPRGIQRGRKQA
jgi:hypothetical protein